MSVWKRYLIGVNIKLEPRPELSQSGVWLKFFDEHPWCFHTAASPKSVGLSDFSSSLFLPAQMADIGNNTWVCVQWYEICLLDISLVPCALSWDINLNTRREIPYIPDCKIAAFFANASNGPYSNERSGGSEKKRRGRMVRDYGASRVRKRPKTTVLQSTYLQAAMYYSVDYINTP